jgi:hypothetical protein
MSDDWTHPMTPSQVAAKVRRDLNIAAEFANTVDRTKEGRSLPFTLEDGSEYELRLPRGLLIDVRAAKSSVNVVVSERGLSGRSPQPDDHVRIPDLIREYEQRVWGGVLGTVHFHGPITATHIKTTIIGGGHD